MKGSNAVTHRNTANNDLYVKKHISHSLSKARKNLISKGYDLPNMRLYFQDDTKQTWSPEKQFIKFYPSFLEDVKSKYGLNLTEKGILFTLCQYINYEDNMLCKKNGDPLHKKDLVNILELGHNAVDKYMASLVRKGILAKTKVKRSVIYFMNPRIFYMGNRIDNTLVSMFDKAQ